MAGEPVDGAVNPGGFVGREVALGIELEDAAESGEAGAEFLWGIAADEEPGAVIPGMTVGVFDSGVGFPNPPEPGDAGGGGFLRDGGGPGA